MLKTHYILDRSIICGLNITNRRVVEKRLVENESEVTCSACLKILKKAEDAKTQEE